MIIYLSEAIIYYKINSTLQREMLWPNSFPILRNLLKISHTHFHSPPATYWMGIWTLSVLQQIVKGDEHWLRPEELHQSYTYLTIVCIICFQRPPKNSDLEAWDVGWASVFLSNPWGNCCITRMNNHWFRGWRGQAFKVRFQQQLLPRVSPPHHKHVYTWTNFSFLKSPSTSRKTSNFVFLIDEKSHWKLSRKTKMSPSVGTHKNNAGWKDTGGFQLDPCPQPPGAH